MNLLAILLATSSGAALPPDPAAFDCQAARVELMRSLKPTVDPRASLEAPEDQDPNSVQFLVVEGLQASEGRVSSNGQVIILPMAAVEGPEANNLIGAKLFARAVDILLAQKTDSRCAPSVVNPGGT
jgi:hypothetical protein